MSYLDSGYNQFFSRDIAPMQTEGDTSVYDFDSRFDGMSADKLTGGTFTSQDGQAIFNLVEGFVEFNQGKIPRIRLGKLVSGKFGLEILDIDGNLVMEASDVTEIKNLKVENIVADGILSVPINVGNESVKIDGSKNRIVVGDGSGPRIVIGNV